LKETAHLDNSVLPLGEEYRAQRRLFDAQPATIQRFLEEQGNQLAEAVVRNQSRLRFTLPDRVVVDWNGNTPASPSIVPIKHREQETGGVIDRLTWSDTRTILRQRLVELEGSNHRSVSASASLIRFATARSMVYCMLPSGKSIIYRAPKGEEIPSIPVTSADGKGSTILDAPDAVTEEGAEKAGRGEPQASFAAEARKFYLPQWVAFDLQGKMLVKDITQAEACLASMQRYIGVLHAAVSLAPYFVADPEYQKKRYGMLGQLINQGRSLARFQTEEMIRIIKQRAAAHDLNRGLSLSMPYFDDQALEMRTRDFVVIPAGRIMFIPAFVVRTAGEEQAKVAQDTRLSPSTRKYLLNELSALESAFKPS